MSSYDDDDDVINPRLRGRREVDRGDWARFSCVFLVNNSPVVYAWPHTVLTLEATVTGASPSPFVPLHAVFQYKPPRLLSLLVTVAVTALCLL